MIGLILTASVLTALVVWTNTGLRVALGVADDYLPDALDTGRISGTLATGLVLEGAAWRDAGVDVEIGRLEVELAGLPLVRGDLLLERVFVADVDVEVRAADAEEPAPETPGGPFRFSMPVPLEIRDGRIEGIEVRWPGGSRRIELINLRAAARGPLLRVDRLDVDSDWLELQAEGRTTFEPPYPATMQVTWRYRTGPEADFAGSGRIDGDADGWSLTHRLLDPEPIRTEGTIDWSERGFHARLSNEFERLEFDVQEGRNITVDEGHLDVEGWLEQFTFDARARLTSGELPTAEVQAGGGGSVERIAVDRLRVNSEAGGLEASGNVELAAEPSWDVAFSLRDLEPDSWGAPVAARVSMRGTSSGYWRSAEEHEVSVLVESLDGTYRGQPVGGRGGVALRGGRLVLDEFELDLGDNRVSADGRVGAAADLDLALTVRAPELGQVWPGIEGALDGRLRVRGRPPVPVLDGSLSGRNIALNGFAVDALALSGVPADSSGLPRASLELREVVVGATRLPLLALDLQGTARDNVIGVRVEGFDAVVTAEGAGTLADDSWTGTLRRLEAAPADLGNWQLREPTGLTVSAALVELARGCLLGSGEEQFCVEGRYEPDKGARGRVDIERLPLAVLAPMLPVDSSFEGNAQGTAGFSWRDGNLDADGLLRVEDGLVRAAVSPDETVDLNIVNLRARAKVEQNRADSEVVLDLGSQGNAELALETADLFDAEAAVGGRLQTDFRDLSMVSLFVPELENVEGQITGEFSLGGTRRRPTLNGALRLQNGGFLFTEAGIEVTDLEIVARQERPGVLEYEGSARSGEGRVAITGTTERPAPDAGWVSRLSIEGNNFQIVRLPDIQATASPELDLLIDDERVELRGSVTVPTAAVTLRQAGPGAVGPSPDVVVHGSTEAEEERAGPALYIEVRAVLGDDVQLQGFGLETGLTGALRLTGGTNRPWLGFGELSLEDARYEAYGQKLKVERGEIAFSGPLDNPALNIRAVRETEDVLAGIYIRGTVRSPESVVFSEPPLPDAEALSYLLTGRALSGATTEGDSDLLSKAALSLGLSRAGALAGGIGSEVGLDTLAVEGGAEDGRVLAGKRLTEDLYLEYAWGIFDQIGTLLVRYDLSDRLRLESQSGEQHAVDLIYRVEKD
ncbi:MAG: translocation/assembly module TamB domain-containing protein [Gammaproteobacteria bacterium]